MYTHVATLRSGAYVFVCRMYRYRFTHPWELSLVEFRPNTTSHIKINFVERRENREMK